MRQQRPMCSECAQHAQFTPRSTGLVPQKICAFPAPAPARPAPDDEADPYENWGLDQPQEAKGGGKGKGRGVQQKVTKN